MRNPTGMCETALQRLRCIQPVRMSVLSVRTRRARRLERRMRIDTLSPGNPPDGERGLVHDGCRYEVLDYPLLRRYLRPLRLGNEDVVFDIGCGMGRVLCVCAQLSIKRCVGIEIAPELAERARENALRLTGRVAPVVVLTQDATTADYSQGSVFILFNPFGRATLVMVLARIKETFALNPRRIRLAYLNPIHEDAFVAAGWLQCVGRDSSPWYRNRASYWEAKP
jgi:SAM-dependent methyltransferase